MGGATHVLILGAGLGGLTLAQCLRKQGVSFEIFERDESIHARKSGWAIAIHTILSKLKESMPDDLPSIEDTNHLRPLNLPAQLCFYDGGQKKAYVESSPEYPILRANRQRLREWLATKIDVQWNKLVSHIEQDGKSVKLTFEDGKTVEGDVLVGADGSRSYVRGHLFNNEIRTSTLPVGVVHGEVVLSGEQFGRQLQLAHSAYVAAGEDFHLYVGLSGVLSAVGDETSKNMEAKQIGADRAKYYWFLNFYDPAAAHEPYWTAQASKEELYDFVLEKTKPLHPRFTEVIHSTKSSEIGKPPIVFRDLSLEDIPDGNITLLGDAAHPMAPFRGEGGSHALEDALRLSSLLASLSVPLALATYKEEMLPRGRGGVSRSRAVLKPGAGADINFAWGHALKIADIVQL